MTVICAWCDRILEIGAGRVSHGICPQCEERVVGAVERACLEAQSGIHNGRVRRLHAERAAC
ncbi:hypothetical protein AYO38_08660 [bacterium SCGC AG-212-C10]|nr:hypothetical protein AYO38_08660 [bacterium SCGC AG-212-C10]